MNTLDQWATAVRTDLGLESAESAESAEDAEGGTAETRTVLDLAREVAHGVERPAAPLTAYLVGIAVGRGMPLDEAARRVQARAQGWTSAENERHRQA